MDSLHNRFYTLREEIWNELEKMVRVGCTISGEFPIIIGEITIPPKGLRTITTCFGDTLWLIIDGIIKDESYSLHPKKKGEKDLNVITNKIKVSITNHYPIKITKIEEITPDLNDIQCLSTYLSGGFNIYR